MDNREVLNCNEHVKAHQRQQLIEWLEGAKSEKIRKLHEEPISMPRAKVLVPSPEIIDKKIAVVPELSGEIQKAGDSVIFHQPVSKANYQFELNEKLFDGITVDPKANLKPNPELSVEINTKEFTAINTSVSLPESTLLPKTVIDPLLVDFDCPEQDLTPPMIHLQENDFQLSMEGITTSDTVKIPEKTADITPDIQIIQTIDPGCVHFEEITDKNTIDMQIQITDMRGIMPVLSPVNPVEISTESVMTNKPMTIDLKKISVPAKPENTDFIIDIRKEDFGVVVPSVDVPPTKPDLNPEIKTIGNISIPAEMLGESPDLTVTIRPLEISFDSSISVIQSPDLQGKIEIVPVDIPTISKPEPANSFNVPEIKMQNIMPHIISDPEKPDLTGVSCTLPYFDGIPNISVPLQNNTISTSSIEIKQESVDIPFIDSPTRVSFPETQTTEIDKAKLASAVTINAPEYNPVNTDCVGLKINNPTIQPISKPDDIFLLSLQQTLSMPTITLQIFCVPDNTSFLEHINGIQDNNDRGGYDE